MESTWTAEDADFLYQSNVENSWHEVKSKKEHWKPQLEVSLWQL